MKAITVWLWAIFAAGSGGFILGWFLGPLLGSVLGFFWGIACGIWAGNKTMLKSLL